MDPQAVAKTLALHPTPWTAFRYTYARNGWADHGICVRDANSNLVMSFDDVEDNIYDHVVDAICLAINTCAR